MRLLRAYKPRHATTKTQCIPDTFYIQLTLVINVITFTISLRMFDVRIYFMWIT